MALCGAVDARASGGTSDVWEEPDEPVAALFPKAEVSVLMSVWPSTIVPG